LDVWAGPALGKDPDASEASLRCAAIFTIDSVPVGMQIRTRPRGLCGHVRFNASEASTRIIPLVMSR